MKLPRWRTACFLLLFLVSPWAHSAEKFLFVRAQNFSCLEEHAAVLESILDAPSAESQDLKARKSIFGGFCLWSSVAMEVVDLSSRKTPKGTTYTCFRHLDPMDRSALGMHCAASDFVTSIEAEIRRRKGDYKVVAVLPFGLKAECVEGGFVVLNMQKDHWERLSQVFPKLLEPPARRVPMQKHRALREGCKGLDYQ